MLIHDRSLWRMVWKEYRDQRAFWLIVAGTALGMMLLFLWFWGPQTGQRDAPWSIALTMPLIFAFGASCVSYASETENGTLDLLRIFAIRTSCFYWGKALVNLAGTVAMWLVLALAAFLATRNDPRPVATVFAEIEGAAIIANTLLLLAWGFCCSLICRRVLTALCLTGVLAPLSMLLIFHLLRSPGNDPNPWTNLGLVPPLLVVGYGLTAARLAVRSRELRLPDPTWLRAGRKRSAAAKRAHWAHVRETAPAWRRTMHRLIWLELRHLVTRGHVLWIAGLLVLTYWPHSQEPNYRDLARPLFNGTLVSLLMGVWSFQSDGGRRTRFLADQGLSPGLVWFSKQLASGLLTILATAPFFVGIIRAHPRDFVVFNDAFWSHPISAADPTRAIQLALWLISIGYATGQFASILIPRTLVAWFVAFVLCWAAGAWTWLIMSLEIPLSIAVAPLLFTLFATTFCWCRNWLLEHAPPRAWIKLASGLTVGLLFSWGGANAWRAYEIPQPEFVTQMVTPSIGESSPWQFVSPPTAPDAGEDDRYLHMDLPNPFLAFEDLSPSSGNELQQKLHESLQKSLDQNRERVASIMHLVRQNPTTIVSPRAVNPILLLLMARERESRGQLDEAADCYVAVLKIAQNLADSGGVGEWRTAVLLESLTVNWMSAWISHPEQTAERLQATSERLRGEFSRFPAFQAALLRQHKIDTWSFQYLEDTVPEDSLNSRERHILQFAKFLPRVLPAERIRIARVLSLVYAAKLNSLDLLEHQLRQREDMYVLPRIAHLAGARWLSAWGSETDRTSSPSDLSPVLSLTKQQGQVATYFAPPAYIPPPPIHWTWTSRTPALAAMPRTDHGVWRVRLRHEYLLRTTVLRLRLAAYRKTQGVYPLRVNPQEFGKIAIDPYTALEFQISHEPTLRSAGRSGRIPFTNALTFAQDELRPGDWILWDCALFGIDPGFLYVEPNGLEDQRSQMPLAPFPHLGFRLP
ncbi:MAG: hypothetical protein JSS02_16470 [Planctomycetes bacterium]|nr:hypothetical protein [Planctomycetota bacterium]